MKYFKYVFFLLIIFSSCKTSSKQKDETVNSQANSIDFIIAFGSCNNQVLPNVLWNEVLKNKPDVWLWGGDIIYTDTEEMALMEENYLKQKNQPDYNNFIKNIHLCLQHA